MENTPQDIPQKRPRGRPKIQPLTKQEYDKTYGKNYRKQYKQKVFEEKGEQYQNIKNSNKKHNLLTKLSFILIKQIKDDPELPQKFKDIINNMYQTANNDLNK